MSRTEELGLPIPRKLIATKEEFYEVLADRKLQNLDMCIDKSLKTIYSKMFAKKRRKSHSESLRSREEIRNTLSKEEYEEWLANISKPKKLFLPEVEEQVKGQVDLDRIKRLAEPRHKRCGNDIEENRISKNALEYVATDRIVNLAKPKKENVDDVVYEIPRIKYPPNSAYATTKSHGIEKLSMPRHPRAKYRKVINDERCSHIPVSRGALQYEPSALIRKLAKPKENEDEEPSDPFQVKKTALKKLPKKRQKIMENLSTPIKWKVTPKYEA